MVIRDGITVVVWALKTLRAVLWFALPIVGLVLWTGRVKPPDLGGRLIEAPSPAAVTAVQHDLEWYAPLWQRDLKQPPIPPPVFAPSPAPAEAAAPLPVLLATYVEKDKRLAHLMDLTGEAHMTRIDGMVDRYRVAAIEPGRVRLQRGDQSHWVEVPKSDGP